MEDGITLRRVLSHTAGIGVPAYPGEPAGAPLPTTADLMAAVRLVGAARSRLPLLRRQLHRGAALGGAGSGRVRPT